jgi:hypothetical protein
MLSFHCLDIAQRLLPLSYNQGKKSKTRHSRSPDGSKFRYTDYPDESIPFSQLSPEFKLDGVTVNDRGKLNKYTVK